MANSRYPDKRAPFFENAAKKRASQHRSTKPRITGKEAVDKATQLQRTRGTEVAEQLYAAGYLSLQCIISYTKITEDYATRIWTVEPYSYRYRWLTSGGRWQPAILKKVFFGYDVDDDTIKMFMYANIHDVTITSDSYEPRWGVEISRPGELASSWSSYLNSDTPAEL